MQDNKNKVKQTLKRNRTKMYFLEAAKAMILNEGVESVSVRKVADMAGYSYPTLYNYYKDLDELLWDVRLYMIQDVVTAMQRRSFSTVSGSEVIKEMFKGYIEYYISNPNIFKFFYFHQFQKPEQRLQDASEEPDFGAIWNETFKGLVADGKLLEKDIETVAKILIYSVHGMLTLCFSNNGDLNDKANIYRDLDKTVNYLFE